MSTCVGKWRRDSETLWRAGKPFPFPESPLTSPPPPPSLNLPTPPPPSESEDGESWPGASVSISLTHSGLRSTWKSAEILQLFATSKSARLMKNGSTWSSGRGKSDARARMYSWPHIWEEMSDFLFQESAPYQNHSETTHQHEEDQLNVLLHSVKAQKQHSHILQSAASCQQERLTNNALKTLFIRNRLTS